MCTSCMSVIKTNDINEVMEYMDKVENPACYQQCDTWLGACSVEMSPQEQEAFSLAVAREQGMPEPVLYDDESPELYQERPEEAILAQVIELQERMSKGMKLIQEAKEKLSLVRGRIRAANENTANRLPYNTYMSLLDHRNQWNDRISKLWNHWFNLKSQCTSLIGDNDRVWVQYFSLLEEAIHPYFITGDATQVVDEQTALHQDANQLADELAFSHVREMSKNA